MKPIHTKIIVSLAVLLILSLALFRLAANKKHSESRVYRAETAGAVLVPCMVVRQEESTVERSWSGIFEADRESRIAAESPGRISSCLVHEGDHVTKGQALIALDNSLLKLQLQSADVQIEGLDSDIAQYEILSAANALQGVVLEKARLSLKAAQVQRSSVLEQIQKTTLRSPFDGIVTALLTEDGSYAVPGAPLIHISDFSELSFSIMVPEADLAAFADTKQAAITADLLPDKSLTGSLRMIGSKGNGSSTFPIRYSVNNDRNSPIRSGMFGTVTLPADSAQKGLVIPAAALVGSSVDPQVYVIKQGKAVLQSIRIGGRTADRVLVAGGLAAGDTVATGGLINLSSGVPAEAVFEGTPR